MLRFRYTTYMGEFHPADRKVVVEFSPGDMPGLTDVQKLKMKKLAGSRYNPEKDIIKMSCERFEHQAQNKRYLGDIIDKMVETAKVGFFPIHSSLGSTSNRTRTPPTRSRTSRSTRATTSSSRSSSSPRSGT